MCIEYQRLLQGWYEAQRLPKDFSPERLVPDFAFNVLNPLGLLYRPIVDEHYLENGGKRPSWPNDKPFAVCLTHDVDAVSTYSIKQSLRSCRSQISFAEQSLNKAKCLLRSGIDITRAASHRFNKDPLHCFERWVEIEKKIGAHSTFFFWPGLSNVVKRHHTDCMYDFSDHVVFYSQKCTVAEMIKEMDQMGWEIGLHPSWYSFDDMDRLKIEKESIEEILGHEILSVRQHYLHYDIRVTPRVHAKTGFKYDSSLGFNNNVGFRFGTSYPWFLYDLNSSEELPIMEVPLIIQDGALLSTNKGLRLDEDTAFEYVMMITDTVEKAGGVLTLCWHANHIVKHEWWKLYSRILNYLHEKNAWFTTVGQVGDCWKCQK